MSRADVLPGLCYYSKFLRISDYKEEMSVCARSLLVHSFGPVVKQDQHGGNIWRELLPLWWPGSKERGRRAGFPTRPNVPVWALPSKGFATFPVASQAGARASAHSISVTLLVTGTKYLKQQLKEGKG